MEHINIVEELRYLLNEGSYLGIGPVSVAQLNQYLERTRPHWCFDLFAFYMLLLDSNCLPLLFEHEFLRDMADLTCFLDTIVGLHNYGKLHAFLATGRVTVPPGCWRDVKFGKMGQVLRDYEQNPAATLWNLGYRIRKPKAIAAVLYAYVVLCCDSYMRPSTNESWSTFARLTMHLPPDLQALVCLRAAGSAADVIPASDVEYALRCLVRQGEKPSLMHRFCAIV
jgi:hypothetical protein